MLNFKRIIVILATLCASVAAFADEKVTFEVNAPMIVAAGEAFKVEFALNAIPDKESFSAPDFTDFDVLAGPATSRGSSVQFINGKMNKSVSYTITYVLLPQKSGTFTIGAAAIEADGKRYSTSPTQIEVKEGGAQQQSAAGSRQESRDDSSIEAQAQGQIAKDDLLLRLNLSRTTVFKGEPIRAALKLYNRVSLADYSVQKMPSFNGFWTQQLEADNTPRRETYNGKVYEVYTLIEYLLYPQQSGTLTIDPVDLTAIVQVIIQNNDNFDPFFGGGREIYNVRRELHTPRITVNVKDFPAGAPASFTGAVGRFTMDASPATSSLAANSASTYTVRITGSGNLAFIQPPTLPLPSSFEQYQVKTSESFKSTGSGTTGYRRFEYPFIARAEGEYTIPPVEFSYFDPERGRYEKLESQAYMLDITPDTSGGSPQIVSSVSKEDVRLLGNDIRFIKLGKPSLRTQEKPAIFSGAYFLSVFGIFGLAAIAFGLISKRMRDRKNIVSIRGKRANKIAVQRFRAAEKHMKQNDRHAFYEEMLKALWGYMSDKFNIPVANLTKENVREELIKRGISSENAQRFTSIISQCDEAQYAPAASTRMNEVYAEGINIISLIETTIKK
ncbi:MAG: protein BatD [Alistipes sp.]|nr:protein BatD [Alistipes sp.]